MINFDEIRKHYYITKLNRLKEQILRTEVSKGKILKKYNFVQFKENSYTYRHLQDRKEFWKIMLTEHSKDLAKITIGGAVAVGVCSMPFAVVGKFDDAITVFGGIWAWAMCCGGLPVVSSAVTYNVHNNHLKRVTKYLKGTYRPINKRDKKLKRLQEKRKRIEGIIDKIDTEQSVMFR